MVFDAPGLWTSPFIAIVYEMGCRTVPTASPTRHTHAF